jgi:hypothetical protein
MYDISAFVEPWEDFVIIGRKLETTGAWIENLIVLLRRHPILRDSQFFDDIECG